MHMQCLADATVAEHGTSATGAALQLLHTREVTMQHPNARSYPYQA
jgi:hypothetical protein